MTYAIIAIILFAAELLYFKIAKKYNIIDRPNSRSSHDYITIRGGGVVFWVAAIVYCFTNFPSFQNLESLTFFIGITLISAVSFIDDIRSLPNKIRIVIHFLSISCVFYGLGIFSVLPVWLIIIAYILFVGILNAYNFMDGINGITGLYSLAVLISLQVVNYKIINFTPPEFINYAIVACVVFLFFNFRKKARCFAGDVGSMAISFWIVTLILQLMLATNAVVWIIFLSVYGIDSVLTIIHRLLLRENIFDAHRKHAYQLMANELQMPHVVVSSIYAALQLLVAAGLLVFYDDSLSYCLIVIILLSAIYILFKKKYFHLHKG